MTLGGLFKQPETVQYPVQTKPAPAGLKGSVTVDVETCILCGICVKRCPCGVIEVDKKARTWSINHFGCVQCGYCVRECPKDSLVMEPHYATPAGEKKPEVVVVPAKEKKPKAKPVEQPAPEVSADVRLTPEEEAKLAAMDPEKAAKVRAAMIAKKAKAKAAEKPAEAAPADVQLTAEEEAKLAAMDPEKAEKVRKAMIAKKAREKAAEKSE